MIRINKIEYINNHILKLNFNDDTEKILDFDVIASYAGVEEKLKDIEYFKKVMILRNGRSFGWENGYDCCADWAYTWLQKIEE